MQKGGTEIQFDFSSEIVERAYISSGDSGTNPKKHAFT